MLAVPACSAEEDSGAAASGGVTSGGGAGSPASGGSAAVATGGSGGKSVSTSGGAATSGASGATGSPATGGAGAVSGGAAGGPPSGSNGGSSGSAGAPPGSGSGGTANTGGGAGGSTAGAGGAATSSAVFTVEVQLASEVEKSAPGTVAIVNWAIDGVTIDEARIELGLDTSYGTAAPVDLAEANYRTLLLGMKPSRTYHFRIVASDGTTEYASDDYIVETGPPTTLVELGDFNVIDEAARERGFIEASYWSGDGSDVPFILDADGEIVWWYDSGLSGGIARARMSADGKNMWIITANNSGTSLRRVSMDTLDAQTYAMTTGSHDLTPVSGEVMAYLDYSESDCDSIFEITPDGTTKEVWESEGTVTANGCHGNALRYSAAEDVYTFSDVSQDIFVVSRAGTLQWRLSERVMDGNEAWGGSQHGHHLLDDSIVVFANRGAGNMASAVVEYTLEGEEVLNYDSGNFSANLGDAQRLPGGNTLVTYSNASIVHEIDPDGNLVLEFDGNGSRIGYTLWRKSLYGAPPDLGM